ncbi:MAG: cytochrome c oxidase assembly protein [Woeseiaceae bacterium]
MTKRRQAILLGGVVILMFGFSFALVPLYDVFCEITGINGKTSPTAAVEQTQAISEREVTIQFVGKVAKGMPWEFRPTESRIKVRLGEMNVTQFYARNRAAMDVTGQAVPSVAPGHAAQYLMKVECFCFNQQPLDAGADTEMGVRFYVSDDLPEDVHTLTLSYTMFPIRNFDVVRHQGSTDHEEHLH